MGETTLAPKIGQQAPTRCLTPTLAVRVGTDLESVSAVESAIRAHRDRYLHCVFTPREVEDCGGPDADPTTLAPGLTARFCAKEAVIKVLRVTDTVPSWTEIEVLRMPGGWTELKLTGSARALARRSGMHQFSLSLSHDRDLAVATVVGVGLFDTTPQWEG